MEIALASGGYSSGSIYRLVLRHAAAIPPQTDVLDFGAGVGFLTVQLQAREPSRRLTGADLLPRPPSLSPEVQWLEADLHRPLERADSSFDAILAAEVIGYLKDAAAIFHEFHRLLRPGGILLVTTPNQESLRSSASHLLTGRYTVFAGNHPGYVSPLLRKDFARLCAVTGFTPPRFDYTNEGRLPRFSHVSWQQLSFGLLRGRLFSDNVLMAAQRQP